MKVLLENLLRNEDGRSVTKTDIEGFVAWLDNKGKADAEIGFRPARVLMQDFTGVPAVVDLAAMRDGMKALRAMPRRSTRWCLSISSSTTRSSSTTSATPRPSPPTSKREYEQNGERYKFLKWGQGAFDNFRVVPPGTGICHQVNLEYLAQTVWTQTETVVKGKKKTRSNGLSRHAGRHRQPHHHGQRPWRSGLGRWRHRG